jgi:hypothetical protein
LVDGEEPVEEFAVDVAYESLGDGIRPWRTHRSLDHLDPEAVKTVSNMAVNFASGSWMRNRKRLPASSRSIERLRVTCSTKKNAWSRVRVMVSRWNRLQARSRGAWARRNSVQEGPACRGEGSTGGLEDLPHGGCAGLVTEAGNGAVHQ